MEEQTNGEHRPATDDVFDLAAEMGSADLEDELVLEAAATAILRSPLGEPVAKPESLDLQERDWSGVRHGNGNGAAKPQRAVLETVVAMPAYNEDVAIASAILQARQYVDKVLVVDDGSADRTSQVAVLAGAVVIRHAKNSGKGASVKTIFDWARRKGVQHLVLMDSDGQHDPAEIPMLLEPIVSGKADIALGFRFGDGTEMPGWRKVGKRVLDYATAFGTRDVTDSQCGYRAFGRRAIEQLDFDVSGFGVESEMLIKAKERGLTFAEVPVTCRYDGVDGSSKGPVVHAVEVLNSVARMVGERKPLLFLGVPAAVSFTLGVLLGMRVLLTLKIAGELAVGSTVLSSLLILAGILTGLTALILHVIPKSIAKQLNATVRMPPLAAAFPTPRASRTPAEE